MIRMTAESVSLGASGLIGRSLAVAESTLLHERARAYLDADDTKKK